MRRQGHALPTHAAVDDEIVQLLLWERVRNRVLPLEPALASTYVLQPTVPSPAVSHYYVTELYAHLLPNQREGARNAVSLHAGASRW